MPVYLFCLTFKTIEFHNSVSVFFIVLVFLYINGAKYNFIEIQFFNLYPTKHTNSNTIIISSIRGVIKVETNLLLENVLNFIFYLFQLLNTQKQRFSLFEFLRWGLIYIILIFRTVVLFFIVIFRSTMFQLLYPLAFVIIWIRSS